MSDYMEKRWVSPGSYEWDTETLEVAPYREKVWITAWDNDGLGQVLTFTPEQAREIAAHLIACAAAAEGESHD